MPQKPNISKKDNDKQPVIERGIWLSGSVYAGPALHNLEHGTSAHIFLSNNFTRLFRSIYNRAVRIDTFIWRQTGFLWIPLLTVIQRLIDSPLIKWLQTNFYNWLFTATWNWSEYTQYILALWVWLHGRGLWILFVFYRGLRRIWLTWLVTFLFMTLLAAMTDHGDKFLEKTLSTTDLSSRWEPVLQMIQLLLHWAAKGCHGLTIFLALPIGLPLTFPVVLYQQRRMITLGIIWWVEMISSLVTHLLVIWWKFLIERIVLDVWNASHWIWVFFLLPLWRIGLFILCSLLSSALALWSGFLYVVGVVIGLLWYTITLLISTISMPLAWFFETLNVLVPTQ